MVYQESSILGVLENFSEHDRQIKTGSTKATRIQSGKVPSRVSYNNYNDARIVKKQVSFKYVNNDTHPEFTAGFGESFDE
jgi:hypothetical protein